MNSMHTTHTAHTKLSHQHLGELYRIQEDLHMISTALAPLQAAEESLYPFLSHLEQMKLLVLKLLNQDCDETIQRHITVEFQIINQKNRHIAEQTALDGHQLHRSGAPIELFNDGQTAFVWAPQLLPDIAETLLSEPQAALSAIQNAIHRVAAYRSDIQNLLVNLRRHSDGLYAQSRSFLIADPFVGITTAAKSTAYRTAAHILQADSVALTTHANKIRTVAMSLLS